MMRWRPWLHLSAAAAATAAHLGRATGAALPAVSFASSSSPPRARGPLLFLRAPPVTRGFASGADDGGGGRRRKPPGEGAVPRSTGQFPPGLSTIERMKLLRAQATAAAADHDDHDDSDSHDAEADVGDETRPGGPLQDALQAHHSAVVMNWLRDLVIGYRLCPWAQPALAADAVRVVIHPGNDAEALAKVVLEEAVALSEMPEGASAPNRTVLVGVPHGLEDFDEFLNLSTFIDECLDELGLRGIVQLATFHPDYTFADSTPEADVENYTNRSPLPVLHLLREVEISRALAGYPGDPARIYERNKAVMRDVGAEQLRALIEACRQKPG